ncbi:hypothetical protein MKX08_007058 [Trichoderma sp. CBMAI-0020]|nr:hypothetical protein MKX08_007058 [Trichoderma sp. CBMAI-0020]
MSTSNAATVLLFGPQCLSFDSEALTQLRSLVVESHSSIWLDTISELPSYWKTLVSKFPALAALGGGDQLQELNVFFKTGTITPALIQLPNVVLTPIVVLTHLAHYVRYVEQQVSSTGGDAEDVFASFAQRHIETLGFCTGLLSAFAVASSSKRSELQQYGAAAIRLAMLVGAIVDAQEAPGSAYGPSELFSVSWNTPETGDKIKEILDLFPEAYISVSYDERRATVTTAESTAAALQQKLREAGVTAMLVGLRGRFHHSCHAADLDSAIEFCASHLAFQFPSASQIAVPIRSNSEVGCIKEGKLHEIALRAILVDHCNWYAALSKMYNSFSDPQSLSLVSFGPERFVPPSIARKLGQRLNHVADTSLVSSVSPVLGKHQQVISQDSIAVVGMACKTAGADDVAELWDILCKGESQHVEVTPDRVSFQTQWRDVDPKRKWFGNFIRDPDAFDHKFFKKSPREVSSSDPQQRLLMQVAYQAVEQSGYFNKGRPDKSVGCYIGVCSTDYENNVACYAPNAFSATGNLRSFIAGKVSHYFGWEGPAMTLDTACSASAVSIHLACQAILSGECTSALAGGTNIMTNPLWFQNLAGASFLSPTGSCKPFDSKADGYCRGEGIAAVFLKKMSLAIADGDQIIGCLAATAVNQNQNCTPIFVPNSPSLSNVFQTAMNRAGLEPAQVTVVEAHGTGTPVGDPAEYESVKKVFGGPIRSAPLYLSSIKGLVGHTESVSGVLSLIKVLLMIKEAYVPPQASFQSMSPHIHASPSDMIEVPTSLKPWKNEFRAALINNYGASGSNASMVVTQSLPAQDQLISAAPIHAVDIKHPFWLSGYDEKSIRQYAGKLLALLKSKTTPGKAVPAVSQLAFNVSRQSNRSLPHKVIFTCGSTTELENTLSELNSGKSSLSINQKKPARPVVLCFGGQVSTFVGLDRQLYDNVKLLRTYLDQCNSALKSIGLDGIYPEIFQRSPVQDTVKLQTMLFAMQYSCAKCWIDCGVEVAAVVGHSFGEITALCISGVLSLQDTVKLVAGRARIVRDTWGQNSGAMMAVEADLDVVTNLLDEANKGCEAIDTACIACFNGPRSFTLAGSSKTMDRIQEIQSQNTAFTAMRTKRLNVTNAFHSALVEPLVENLERVGEDLTFKEPHTPIERATEAKTTSTPTAKFTAEHMRFPVYFNHAVQRLSKDFPSCIYLEAGSSSTITIMASRALGAPAESHFQAMNLTSDSALQNLVDTTANLWKEGVPVQFWGYHPVQTREYDTILLPPYQFEKSKHWLEMKIPSKATEGGAAVTQAKAIDLPKGLWTFAGYQDKKQKVARFTINTEVPEYQEFVSGHTIAGTAPICPATLEVDMAIEALSSIRPDLFTSGFLPQIQRVDNQAPICIDPSRVVHLDFEAADADGLAWDWKIVSSHLEKSGGTILHVTGKITWRSKQDVNYKDEFARLQRLVPHERCKRVLETDEADDIIQGRNIYTAFSSVVDYGEQYRGVKKLVGRGNESAGRVTMGHAGKTWLDTHLSDCFSQVGGIWVNCMTDSDPADMFIANGFDQWMRSPDAASGKSDARPKVWDVFASHHRASEKAYVTDIFIFDATSGQMTEAILGINYHKVPKLSMSKVLARLTSPAFIKQGAPSTTGPAGKAAVTSVATTAVPVTAKPVKAAKPVKEKKPKKEKVSKVSDVAAKCRSLLNTMCGLEPGEIKDESTPADLGIDSLMGMEVAREIESEFKCEYPAENLMDINTFLEMVKSIEFVLGVTSVVEDESDSESDISDDDDVDDTPSESLDDATSQSSVSTNNADVLEYLADFLGLEKGDVALETLLRDLGVDSLLSTELRMDISGKFDVHISESVAIEELSVKELQEKINGVPAESPKPAATKSKKRAEVTVSPVAAPQPSYSAVPMPQGDLDLPTSKVLSAFGETKRLTDQFIADYRCAGYLDAVYPKQTRLCIALTVEAFEKLGCSLRSTAPGQKLTRVSGATSQQRLVDHLYLILERDARLIDVINGEVVRTDLPVPDKSSKAILEDLVKEFPDHVFANKLTYYAGAQLADVITEKTDGVKVVFGSAEGRDLVSGLYGDSLLNKLSYKIMEDFLKRLAASLPMYEGKLKILEMGAGTGGTTKWLVPLVASLGIPVEYTFTDLSPGFVAAARNKFKQYPFMKYAVHDIEKAPQKDLVATQHIVVASNAIHATTNMVKSLENTRQFLRPDGFLMMLEMTETLSWVDIIFGLFEGWWLFKDGRNHAIAHESRWEETLHSVGYGHVDWTDGYLPETTIQRVFIALGSGSQKDRLPLDPKPLPKNMLTDLPAREAAVGSFVQKYSSGFAPAAQAGSSDASGTSEACVLVTGASGSLGAHLVAHFSNLPEVKSVICLNRRSAADPDTRQRESFRSKGITLQADELSKLKVIETDTSKPNLGLSDGDYLSLSTQVTHIVHNAWPMSAKRPINGFENQFQVLRNLIDLAAAASAVRPQGFKVGFQFISSIATTGHYPLWSGKVRAPEERVQIDSVLPSGYSDAKYACERLLDETLHKHPDRFRTMAARIGQIAGSTSSGYWNTVEHFCFLVKSAQTLSAVPDFDGVLSWCPVDIVAGTLSDLLLADNTPYPIYHVDNPVQQPWKEMTPRLANALGVPSDHIIPWSDWLTRVRQSPLPETENPAVRLVGFLEEHFLRMSCGGLILDTTKSCEHSKTLAATGAVSEETLQKYVRAWRECGYLR